MTDHSTPAPRRANRDPNRLVYDAELACIGAAEKLEAAADDAEARDADLASACRLTARVIRLNLNRLLPRSAAPGPADTMVIVEPSHVLH